jgi:hypothetical protein
LQVVGWEGIIGSVVMLAVALPVLQVRSTHGIISFARKSMKRLIG